MTPELLALIEKMVLSPTIQDAAWTLIKPGLMRGVMPSPQMIAEADKLADRAHALAQAKPS